MKTRPLTGTSFAKGPVTFQHICWLHCSTDKRCCTARQATRECNHTLCKLSSGYRTCGGRGPLFCAAWWLAVDWQATSISPCGQCSGFTSQWCTAAMAIRSISNPSAVLRAHPRPVSQLHWISRRSMNRHRCTLAVSLPRKSLIQSTPGRKAQGRRWRRNLAEATCRGRTCTGAGTLTDPFERATFSLHLICPWQRMLMWRLFDKWISWHLAVWPLVSRKRVVSGCHLRSLCCHLIMQIFFRVQPSSMNLTNEDVGVAMTNHIDKVS